MLQNDQSADAHDFFLEDTKHAENPFRGDFIALASSNEKKFECVNWKTKTGFPCTWMRNVLEFWVFGQRWEILIIEVKIF